MGSRLNRAINQRWYPSPEHGVVPIVRLPVVPIARTYGQISACPTTVGGTHPSEHQVVPMRAATDRHWATLPLGCNG
jgi:hypothetical protein